MDQTRFIGLQRNTQLYVQSVKKYQLMLNFDVVASNRHLYARPWQCLPRPCIYPSTPSFAASIPRQLFILNKISSYTSSYPKREFMSGFVTIPRRSLYSTSSGSGSLIGTKGILRRIEREANGVRAGHRHKQRQANKVCVRSIGC